MTIDNIHCTISLMVAGRPPPPPTTQLMVPRHPCGWIDTLKSKGKWVSNFAFLHYTRMQPGNLESWIGPLDATG